MKAAIHREELYSDQLSWLSVKPMLLSVRGKDVHAKAEVYRQLSEGQRALYLFYSYHNHTGSLAEFYWFSAYYMIEYKAWDEMKNAVRYFEDPEFVRTLGLVYSAIERKLKVEGNWTMAKPQDIEMDLEFQAAMQTVYDRYRKLTPQLIKRMNDWVFARREEYFVLD